MVMRIRKSRIKRPLILLLVSILTLSILIPTIGIIGDAKDAPEYDHIIVLSSYNDYSATTSIKCRLGDRISIDMRRLDDPIGKLYIQIIDPFDRVWKSYEIKSECDRCNQTSLILDMPTDGIYKIQVSIPFLGEDATVAYTITHRHDLGRFRPSAENDIKLPGSFDLK
ncbi:MAG TPA: hypothetical protein HA341_06770 [Halobacteria archaeon]|jgi:hypothetical protein|nr:hypothetical protein [Halobacteria archaeon]